MKLLNDDWVHVLIIPETNRQDDSDNLNKTEERDIQFGPKLSYIKNRKHGGYFIGTANDAIKFVPLKSFQHTWTTEGRICLGRVYGVNCKCFYL